MHKKSKIFKFAHRQSWAGRGRGRGRGRGKRGKKETNGMTKGVALMPAAEQRKGRSRWGMGYGVWSVSVNAGGRERIGYQSQQNLNISSKVGWTRGSIAAVTRHSVWQNNFSIRRRINKEKAVPGTAFNMIFFVLGTRTAAARPGQPEKPNSRS